MEYALAANILLTLILVIAVVRQYLVIRQMEANYDWAVDNLCVTMTKVSEKVDTMSADVDGAKDVLDKLATKVYETLAKYRKANEST